MTSEVQAPTHVQAETPHSPARVVTAIAALALGGFVIGTTEFVTMGLLPDIATDCRAARHSRGTTACWSSAGQDSHALTLSGLASTHFFAAASALILSSAMYLATRFWSALVQVKFFTSV